MSLTLQSQLKELKPNNQKNPTKIPACQSAPVGETTVEKSNREENSVGKHRSQQQAGEQSHPSGTAHAQEQISLGLNIVKKEREGLKTKTKACSGNVQWERRLVARQRINLQR